MAKSLIWDTEEDYRKDEIAEWFEDATGLTRTDKLKDYESKIANLIQKEKDGEHLTNKQKDLVNYVKGEINVESLVNDTFEKIKDIQKTKLDEIIKEIIDKRTFKKVKGRTYKVADKKTTGFVKGIEQKVVIEEYVSKGEKKYRVRNKRGHFASFISSGEIE